jgi:hypothetical protein
VGRKNKVFEERVHKTFRNGSGVVAGWLLVFIGALIDYRVFIRFFDTIFFNKNVF